MENKKIAIAITLDDENLTINAYNVIDTYQVIGILSQCLIKVQADLEKRSKIKRKVENQKQ